MKKISELLSLRDRVALITGGLGHVGLATVETLAELGAKIVVIDNHSTQVKSFHEVLKNMNCEGVFLEADLTNTEKLNSIPKQVFEKFGRLDIIIHSAALTGDSLKEGWNEPFERQSIDHWRSALEVNLTSMFPLIQASLPYLRESRHSSIIMFSSIYGVVAPTWDVYNNTHMSNPAAYSVSKGALLQFTRWLATSLAPKIRVNSISPGGIFRGHGEPFLSNYISKTPLKRMASEEDLKGAIAYLSSDLSQYVTGQNLIVDGGWTIQ